MLNQKAKTHPYILIQPTQKRRHLVTFTSCIKRSVTSSHVALPSQSLATYRDVKERKRNESQAIAEMAVQCCANRFYRFRVEGTSV